MRHYLNLRILWAVLTKFATVGPYKLDWESEQYKCWISQVVTFVLLASLQALNLFWLFLILRIAWNYVATSVPRDETSDVEMKEEIQDADASGAAIEETDGAAKTELELLVHSDTLGEVTFENGPTKEKKEG